MITEQHKELTLRLASALQQRAEELSLETQYNDSLRNEFLFSKTKQAKKLQIQTSLPSVELPSERIVLEIHTYTILITAINFDLENFENEYEIAIWWAALIRSHLKSGIEDDLHLIIVGPPNSGADERSCFLKELIEQDEKFCRKLVWLPKTDELGGEILQDFIDRTFLARPWFSPNNQMQIELDAVSFFLKRTSHPQINGQIVSDWLSIASRGDVVGSELVGRILERYELNE